MNLLRHQEKLREIMKDIEVNQNFGKAMNALKAHRGVAFHEKAELRILYKLITDYAKNIDAALALLEQAEDTEHKKQAASFVNKAFQIVAEMRDVLRGIEIDEKKEE